MKTWLRGSWEVQPGQALGRFPILSDKFNENELILPLHLTAEGFPTPWGPAHAFATRLTHSLLSEEVGDAYRQQCHQAALDLLTLVVAQFLGLLKAEEIPIGGTNGSSSSSRLLRLVNHSLAAEKREMPMLVVLRDPRLADTPIAAINYPDCLWFPVQSYRLDGISQRVRQLLGEIHLKGLWPSQTRPEEEVQPLIGQLRTYVRQHLANLEQSLACHSVLANFEGGLQVRPEQVPIRSVKISILGPGGVTQMELRRSSEPQHEEIPGCPDCGQDWMNHRYSGGSHRLVGGTSPKRNVICPIHQREIPGWTDLMERSVFFDEAESEYVIWADDPTEEKAQGLRMPPNGERIEVQRTGGGRGRAHFRFNQAEIVVEGRIVKLGDVMLRQVVELPASANAQALPINGEESVCIDWQAGGVREDATRKGFWNIQLRGGWRPLSWEAVGFRDPDLSEPENVTLLLWPGIDDPDWKAETVVYGLRKVRAANAVPPKIRCYGSGSRNSRLIGVHEGIDISRSMLHFRERVEALEVRSPSDEPWGYLVPKRRSVPTEGQIVETTVALDFGTSNTAIAWLALNNEVEAIAVDQDTPPLELMAPVDASNRRWMAETLNVLPFWPREPVERWYIPSELLFFPQSRQWAIPRDSEEAKRFEKQDIRRDFKWKDQEGQLRYTYLSFVLRMALANLRGRGIRKINLRATYPLAFGGSDLEGYAEILERVIAELSSDTGMMIYLAGYANESISGMDACRQRTGNLHCVIDLGGGTTDIAVQILDSSGEFTEPLYVDSLRLAGNHVIESLLADREILRSLLEYGKVSPEEKLQKEVARRIVTQELRNSGASTPKWWRFLADRNSVAAQQFALRSRAYFDGILAYVLKLISAAQREMVKRGALREEKEAEVAIFLLGQGWGLLRLQIEKGDFEPRSYVKRRLEDLRLRIPDVPSRCTFEVLSPGHRLSASPKLATSFGALTIPNVRPAGDLKNTTGRETIFGLSVDFSDGNRVEADEILNPKPEARRADIRGEALSTGAWDQFIGPLLKGPAVTAQIRELFGSTDEERRAFVENTLRSLIHGEMAELKSSLALRTSPLILLLEKIWAEQLKRLDSQVRG